jgi:hypothetical protein
VQFSFVRKNSPSRLGLKDRRHGKSEKISFKAVLAKRLQAGRAAPEAARSMQRRGKLLE